MAGTSLNVQFTALRRGSLLDLSVVGVALATHAQEYAQRVVDATKPYPAWTSPRYVRTGALGRSWKVSLEFTGGAIRARIRNQVQKRGRTYAKYVHGPGQGEGGQAGFHAEHGWQNIDDHMDRVKFAAECQAIINSLVR